MLKKYQLIAFILAVIALVILLTLKSAKQDSQANIWQPGIEFMAQLNPSTFANTIPTDIRSLEGSEGGNNNVVLDNQSQAAPLVNTTIDNNDQYFKAIKLMKDGAVAKANTLLKAHLEKNPEHAEGWRQLGDCRYNMGDVSGALEAYRTSLSKDSRNYLAERGRGIASLYMGYETFAKGETRLANTYFQTALNSLHSCLNANREDQLAQYGQALAAEGASRKLYEIAKQALGGENHEQAKDIIRNCLDIIDVAIDATHTRLRQKPDDNEAKMLLGCLLIRRAKVLQPFGHQKEALENINAALKAFAPVAVNNDRRAKIARGQLDICEGLIREWKE